MRERETVLGNNVRGDATRMHVRVHICHCVRACAHVRGGRPGEGWEGKNVQGLGLG